MPCVDPRRPEPGLLHQVGLPPSSALGLGPLLERPLLRGLPAKARAGKVSPCWACLLKESV